MYHDTRAIEQHQKARKENYVSEVLRDLEKLSELEYSMSDGNLTLFTARDLVRRHRQLKRIINAKMKLIKGKIA